jgi:hypothetical protein
MIAQGRGGRIIGKLTVSLLWFALLTLVWPLSYRRMLRHRQARTGFPERLLCEQICYSSIDSVSRCVYVPSTRFRCCSHADAFTINLALEFGQHGITVNAYAAGPVKTPMCMLPRHLPKIRF